MNNFIKIFLALIATAVVLFIIIDFTNNRPDKLNKNPFEYNVEEFKHVDPKLISHKEVLHMKVDVDDHSSISTNEDKIYLASNNEVKIITIAGKAIGAFRVDENSTCIKATKEQIIVGFKTYFKVYTHQGETKYQSELISDSSLFTSVNVSEDKVIVADAGKRKVLIFKAGKLEGEIEGVSGANNGHGFIVPSAKFDLSVNTEGELWVVNPGLHSMQQYDIDGNLHDSWQKTSIQIEGFSGCCNPAHLTMLDNGSLVTSEKGMPRIKIYNQRGKLQSVVAPPTVFTDNGQACDVAALGKTIVALDYDKKLIRIFEEK